MKNRLDRVLLERGLAGSRERARSLIMQGKVLVSGIPITKAGTLIDKTAAIGLKEEDFPYVSRGGVKLEAALDNFCIQVNDKIAMDVGASTGGFTDCLLQRGATKVYCIDVGYGQLAWKLRNDPRVVLFERTNIRHLEQERIAELIDICTIDVSFISLLLVVPKIMQFMRGGGDLIVLIKPQFEVGRGEVGRGGIVRDDEKRLEAVKKVTEGIVSLGLQIQGILSSPIEGQKGNKEFLAYFILK